MSEESIVLKRRDPFSDVELPQSRDELAKFMDEPLPAIAETITGLLAGGPKSWAVNTGRIVQAIVKGKLFQQLASEIKELRDKGKIPSDFADEKKNKYSFQSWVELLRVIDEDLPDADRLEALKAMFYSINKVNALAGERVVAYQLFQIAKKLTSGQLLYLKASYDFYKNRDFSTGGPVGSDRWFAKIGKALGHDVIGLLEQDDLALEGYGLLTRRLHPDKSGISENNAHLSALGIIFCKNIETYCIETSSEE